MSWLHEIFPVLKNSFKLCLKHATQIHFKPTQVSQSEAKMCFLFGTILPVTFSEH